jgi:hypothetical protein
MWLIVVLLVAAVAFRFYAIWRVDEETESRTAGGLWGGTP